MREDGRCKVLTASATDGGWRLSDRASPRLGRLEPCPPLRVTDSRVQGPRRRGDLAVAARGGGGGGRYRLTAVGAP
jgi:hypothetical protein